MMIEFLELSFQIDTLRFSTYILIYSTLLLYLDKILLTIIWILLAEWQICWDKDIQYTCQNYEMHIRLK